MVDVTMRDYEFDYAPPSRSGRVVFRVFNDGKTPHQLSLLPLDEDIPPIEQQVRGSERRAVTPYAGIPPHAPGTGSGFAVDLVPGRRYAFICFVTTPDGESHAVKGMTSEFRAPGTAAVTTTTTGPSPTSGRADPPFTAAP